MIHLLFEGKVALFCMLLGALIFSLTLHEFGHAISAKMLGDRTAEQAGRLTLNPVPHIDPLGLLMVVFVGFGWAKPVPFNPNRTNVSWAGAFIGAAGPFMNLLVAIVSINVFMWAYKTNAFDLNGGMGYFLMTLASINLLLMLFNLIPLGPLDGHYVMSWLLPRNLSYRYDQFNAQYGSMIFLILIVLSILGFPVFDFLIGVTRGLLPYLTFV